MVQGQFHLLVSARRASGAGAQHIPVFSDFHLLLARRARVVCATRRCADSGLTFVDF
ncbi:hypothetical protein A2U01_0118476 [Trifolium medium]|uniref:Uncharacterized protein n=1 Tax=Trifolium medium TaxID=97028 RepID=A0A392WF10_9FABA|nr:hypothetical protein [Trifolium medium]